MSSNRRLNTSDTINTGQAGKSDVTGTTVGNKRLLDVNVENVSDSAQAFTPRTKKVFNEVIASANTEQSLVMPTKIVGYLIRTRGSGRLKLTHTSGESGTKYMEVPPRANHYDDHHFESLTIYFQSPSAGDVIEVITWE